ncbi:MAG: hypothetical protein CMJ75_15565 [Planctomycetaceae bacterium]|nr:hypothetical protein [Planctomycetaceae bacterium]
MNHRRFHVVFLRTRESQQTKPRPAAGTAVTGHKPPNGVAVSNVNPTILKRRGALANVHTTGRS